MNVQKNSLNKQDKWNDVYVEQFFTEKKTYDENHEE